MIGSSSFRCSVHGVPLTVDAAVPWLDAGLSHFLGAFVSADRAFDTHALTGIIRKFDEPDVLKHMSPRARRTSRDIDLAELYEDGERFWLVDERWGIAEVNLLRSQWRSWVLPSPRVRPEVALEGAVVWPLAQLMRSRGLHLVPAISVSRANRGVLIVSPYELGTELSTLIDSGYRVVGQRWTAIREDSPGNASLLRVPGWVRRTHPRHVRIVTAVDDNTDPNAAVETWHDLQQERPGSTRPTATLSGVVVIEAGRRPHASHEVLSVAEARVALRHAWPIVELHPRQRPGYFTTRLATHTRCVRAELSRRPHDILAIVAAALNDTPPDNAKPQLQFVLKARAACAA